MARKRPVAAGGRLLELGHESRVLRGNRLGDPHVRRLHVWLPPQYDQAAGRGRGRRFPVLFDLVGYTGAGFSHTHWRPFDESLPERAARLVHERKLPPVILVFPDCFTSLGGNQYINSSAIGRYADYLTRELVPTIDRELRTLAAREHRGCFGKSSGGYGAMLHGMKYPQTWGAIANHSGDADFDSVYRPEWPRSLDELARHARRARRPGPIDVTKTRLAAESDGRVKRFLTHVWRQQKLSNSEVMTLMNLCMAASYDPDPRAELGFRLPFDLETGELIPERWRRWLAHDPVRLVERYRKNLSSLRGLWIDCGWRDQYRIHYGSRRLSEQLRKHRVTHRYEEFDATHSGIDYRMERSLPFLYRALRP